MYVMVDTKPSITYKVSVVNKFMLNVAEKHWEAMKVIMWYTSSTRNQGLSFGVAVVMKQESFTLKVYNMINT